MKNITNYFLDKSEDLIDKLHDAMCNFLNKTIRTKTVGNILIEELSEKDVDNALLYSDDVTLQHKPFSRAQALRWAFDWKDTTEGFSYWERIHDRLWIKDKLERRTKRIKKTILWIAVLIFIVSMYGIYTYQI